MFAKFILRLSKQEPWHHYHLTSQISFSLCTLLRYSLDTPPGYTLIPKSVPTSVCPTWEIMYMLFFLPIILSQISIHVAHHPPLILWSLFSVRFSLIMLFKITEPHILNSLAPFPNFIFLHSTYHFLMCNVCSLRAGIFLSFVPLRILVPRIMNGI